MKKSSAFHIFVVLIAMISFGWSVNAASVKRGGIVNVIAEKQGILIKNFNPFSPKVLHPVRGCFYEPLVFANAYKGEITPWLAKSFEWSNDLKTITFQLHQHIKWNDGKPFTADDVLFTVMLGKDNKALDREGLWKKGLVDVRKTGKYSIEFEFNDIRTTILPSIGGVYIVPKHIWSSVEAPATWTGNENPIGTGPFMFVENSFTEQSYKLKRNPNYWQMGKDGKPLPYIDGVQYIGATGNSQLTMKVISGQVDWGNVFIANIDKLYVKRDPKHNHYWLPEGSMVYLNMNNGKTPFDNLNVRRAIAMAVDQKQVTTIMASGALPANQSGIKSGYSYWITENARKYALSFDPAGAMKLLEREGYRKNGKGIYEKNGAALSFNLYVPTGWTDWVTAVDTISTQLAKIGVEANVSQVAWPSPFLTNITKGEYEMSIDYVSSGFSPYFQYDYILPNRHWAPIGEDASGHSQVRYRNPEVDKAIAAFSKTADTKKQAQYMDVVITAVMRDTPLIPLFFNPTWYEYSTRRFTGWASAENPYTAPSSYGMMKMPVFLNLQPR